MKKNKHNRLGFTLIELLVVIAIIGLLSTLAVVSLNSARRKSRDAKRMADINRIQSAIEFYYMDRNEYPALGSSDTIGPLGTGNYICLQNEQSSSGAPFESSGCVDPYMAIIPTDPSYNSSMSTCTSMSDSGICSYGYKPISTATQYEIYSYLEGPVNNLKAGPICATEAGVTDTTRGCLH